jgi:AraC-like DNA-binding protein
VLPGYYFIIRFHWIPVSAEPFIQSAGTAAYSLLMPFLYLYICSLTKSNFQLKIRHMLHGLPYAIIVTVNIILLSLRHFHSTEVFIVRQADWIRLLFTWSAIHVQVACYLVIVFKNLADYRKRLKDFYSNIEQIDLTWMDVLLYGFGTMWFLNVLSWILIIAGIKADQLQYFMTFVSVIINLLFALTVTYKSIIQSDYLMGIAVPGRYTSRLTRPECANIVEKLIQYMESERLYLTPSLSVEDLARCIKTPARHVSQSIHVCLKSNFYDFVNRYRIEEVKRRIGDASSQHLSFLGLAYEAGFNSKSVFNAAFKKHTGITPKEFKRTLP